jgi:Transcriptional regulatory protein, C terminal
VVRFTLLGLVRVAVGDREIPLSPAERTVLAALLLRAGEVVSVAALAEAIWGDAPPLVIGSGPGRAPVAARRRAWAASLRTWISVIHWQTTGGVCPGVECHPVLSQFLIARADFSRRLTSSRGMASSCWRQGLGSR